MRTSHRKIERLVQEKVKTITDRELFTSPAYEGYLTDIAETVSGRYRRALPVKMLWDDSEHSFAADTDNDHIRINAASPLANAMPTRPLRALSVMGSLAHELGHILYTDFRAYSQYQEELARGRMIPAPPEVPPELEDSLKEVQKAIRSPDQAVVMTVVEAAHSLYNIMEDSYIEWRVCEEYPGKFRSGILLNNVKNMEILPSVKEQLEIGNMPFGILQNLLIQHYKGGGIKEQDGFDGEYAEVMDDCIPVFESVRYDDDPAHRQQAVSWLIVRLWPYIRDLVEITRQKMAEGRALSEILKELAKELLKGLMGSSDMPKGDSIPIFVPSPDAGSDLAAEREELKDALSGEGVGDTDGMKEAENDLDRLFRGFAKNAAEQEAERQLNAELQKEADGIDRGELCKSVPVKVIRMSAGELTPELKQRYQQLYPEIRPVSKRLQSKVSTMLRDKRGGGKLTGLLMGKKFDAHTLYRRDGRNFYNLRLPEETELAVSLLVDESGSMKLEDRFLYARKAAAVLYDFCVSLGLPVSVYGHDDVGHTEIFAYADFDSVDGLDKFRMMDIQHRCNNRDGLALRFTAEHLLKRPETVKLLILISDGKPNADGYTGSGAEKDLRSVKQEYARKGITLFAAAIGSDKENIQRIYGDGFLDITDLNALPMNLSKLILKFLK